MRLGQSQPAHDRRTGDVAAAAPAGDAKRTHARVQAPFIVVVGTERFRTIDWSLTGFGVRDPKKILTVGERFSFQARLHLNDCQLVLEMTGSPVRRDGDRVGCRFEEPTRGQRQLLRYLQGAYRSGLQVEADDAAAILMDRGGTSPDRSAQTPVTQPATTPSHSRRAQHRTGRRGRWRNRPWRPRRFDPIGALALVALIPVALAVLLYGSFVLAPTAESLSGTTVERRNDVLSPSDGFVRDILAAPGQVVAAGSPLFVLQQGEVGTAVERTTIPSPCDCRIDSLAVAPGQAVATSSPLATLSARGAQVIIAARVPSDEAATLEMGRRVDVRLATSAESLQGRIIPTPQPLPAALPEAVDQRSGSLVFVSVEGEASPGNGVPARIRWRGSLLPFPIPFL